VDRSGVSRRGRNRRCRKRGHVRGNQSVRGREAGVVAAFGEGAQSFGEWAMRGAAESFVRFFLDAPEADLDGLFLVPDEQVRLRKTTSDSNWIIEAQLNLD
jgi:hypothetical protein